MSGTNIRAVLNGGFINRLGALGAGATRASSAASTLSLPSTAVTVELGESLRIGARSFTKAVENLNLAASFVSLSESSLLQLRDVTEEMISVAEEATRSGIGSQRRQRLDTRFRELSSDFQEIVSGSVVGNLEFLTVEGLSEVFTNVGLSKERSRSIAELFAEFVTSKDDSSLASEKTLSSTKGVVSREAYGGVLRYELSDFQAVLPEDFQTGGTSTIGSISSDNNGTVTVHASVEAGYTSALLPGLSANASILEVNEVGGTALVFSSDDLARTGTTYAQVYLVNNRGDVLQQVTNYNASQDVVAASLSSDNLVIAVQTENGSRVGVDVFNYSSTGLTGDPDDAVVTNIASNELRGVGGADLVVNNEGTKVAYLNGSSSLRVFDVATSGTTDHSSLIPTKDFVAVDFYTEDDLAVLSTTPFMVMLEVQFAILDNSAGTITNLGETDQIEVRTSGGRYIFERNLIDIVQGSQSIAFYDEPAATVRVGTLGDEGNYSSFSTREISYDLGSAGTVERISAASADGSSGSVIDVGVSVDGQLLRLDANSDNSLFTPTTVSDSLVSNINGEARITQTGEFYTGLDNLYGFQDSNLRTVFSRTTDAYTTTQSGGFKILDVNEVSGFSLAVSNEDPLGFNSGARSQLFILDPLGRVVSQVTDNQLGDTFSFGALSDDGKKIVFAQTPSLGVNNIRYLDIGSVFGVDPSGLSSSNLGTGLVLDAIRISGNGAAFAYGTSGTIQYGATVGGSSVESFSVAENSVNDYGFDFIGADTIAYASEGSTLVQMFNTQTEEIDPIFSGVNQLQNFSAYQSGDGSFVFSYYDAGTNEVKAFDSRSSEPIAAVARFVTGDDSVENVQAVLRGDTLVIGVLGVLDSGSSKTSLYELDARLTVSSSSPIVSRRSLDVNSVFAEGRSLTRRPDAYRIEADLRALGEQIEQNLSVLQDAKDTIERNLELARETAASFLENAKILKSESDANEVARQIRQSIIQNARGSLSEAGNLESLAVAALINDSNSGIFS